MSPFLLFGLGFVAIVAAIALFFARESIAASVVFVIGAALDAVAALMYAKSKRSKG
jgi:hypothetical protein